MKLTLRRDLGGYALPAIIAAGIDGTVLDRPFTLFTGPNGAGKSAVMRGIRASIGLRGDRAGSIETPMQRHLDPEDFPGDAERLATQVRGHDGSGETAAHVPVAFDVSDLGWRGNPTHLFDSRSTSGMATSAQLDDDDMMHHASMIMGGGAKASHGQFVSKAWWEAIEWAAGEIDLQDPWSKSRPSPARTAVRDAALGGLEPATERWLMIDEPETAIDVQTLLVGMAVLLEVAELGRLRVFCASHSLLFAAGLGSHPKIQSVDLGGTTSWIETQRIALRVADDSDRIADIGRDVLSRITKRNDDARGTGRQRPTRGTVRRER